MRTIIGDNIIGKRIDNQIDYQIELIETPLLESSSPPINQLLDLYPQKTSLLLHMNGVNGSTTFVNSSINPLIVTPYGNTQISTAKQKFGNGSAIFERGEDVLEITDLEFFDFRRENFTIECWIYITDFGGTIVAQWGGTNSVFFYGDVNQGLVIYLNNQYLANASGGTLMPEQWHHVCLLRDGNKIKSFIDGQQVGNGHTFNSSLTSALYVGQTPVRIGGDLNVNTKFQGYIDELRITNGVARYAGNFQPQKGQFIDPDSNSPLVSWIEACDIDHNYQIGSWPNQTSVTIANKSNNTFRLYGGKLVENLLFENIGTDTNVINVYMSTRLDNLNTLSFMNVSPYRMGWNELNLNKNWNKFDNISGLTIDGFNTIYLPDTPDKVGTLPNLTYLQINTRQLSLYSQAVSSPFNIEKFLMSDVDDEFSIPEKQFNTSAGGLGILTPLDQNSLNLIFSGIDANGKEDGTIITDYVDMGDQDGNNVILDNLYAKGWSIDGPSWTRDLNKQGKWLTVEESVAGINDPTVTYYRYLTNPIVSGHGLVNDTTVYFKDGSGINSLIIRGYDITDEGFSLGINMNGWHANNLTRLEFENIMTSTDGGFGISIFSGELNSLTGLYATNCGNNGLSLDLTETPVINNFKELILNGGSETAIGLTNFECLRNLEKLILSRPANFNITYPSVLPNLTYVELRSQGNNDDINALDLLTKLNDAGNSSGNLIIVPTRNYIWQYNEEEESFYSLINDLKTNLESKGWTISGINMVYP